MMILMVASLLPSPAKVVKWGISFPCPLQAYQDEDSYQYLYI